jgi:Fe-S-cluster containining protein
MTGEFRRVPCGSCHDCCTGNELVVMTPHDDASKYETETIRLNGAVLLVLKRKPNGDCIYLDAGRCSIHGDQPHVCKIFDCRLAYLQWMERPRHERRAMSKRIPGQKEAMMNAKRMLDEHPLDDEAA